MFVSSPYPWHYTLRWPFYYIFPSTHNHIGLVPYFDHLTLQKDHKECIRLLFSGDLMTLNKDTIPTLHSALCDLINSADYFIGNCEAVLGHHKLSKRAKYGFTFHMPRSYLENIIKQTHLPPSQWMLSMANNHIGDKELSAVDEHKKILTEMGIHILGEYNDSNLPIYIIEKNSLRIGFCAWTEWMNRDIFDTLNRGVNRQNEVLSYQWREVKSTLNIDYLFGLPHWEYEFQHFPCKKTHNLAKYLIDERGIDFIVGSHTHTLQPIEKFSHGWCLYNLGNFSGQGRAWSVKLNTLLEVNLQKNSKCPLISYKLHYFFQEHKDGAINIIPLQEAPSKTQVRLRSLIKKLYITNSI